MSEIKPILNTLMRSKAGALLLILQIAITLAIVSNAISIVSDRVDKLREDTGYDEQGIIAFTVLTYNRNIDRAKQFKEDMAKLKEIDGVIEAMTVSSIPLSSSGGSWIVSDTPDEMLGKRVDSGYIQANYKVLSALGLSLSEGRDFEAQDESEGGDGQFPSVTIVSRAVANKLFGEGKGLNEFIYSGDNMMKIVGIVETMKSQWPDSKMGDNVMLIPRERSSMYQRVIVKTEPSKRSKIMKLIEPLLLENERQRVIIGIKGLDEAKAQTYQRDTLMIRMLVALIVFLAIITALGIFGLTHFNISKRTKQIGTRRALGARKSAIFSYFLIENALVTVFGLVVGALAALYLGGQLMALYNIPALDWSMVFYTALTMLAMSLLSVYQPAKRAANISPSIATRSI
ncbi:FtsX-like permease family protein [Pseudoalteromonas luteoviolacea]|uniref:ABC transporter permease n=1 Tax=Pseudoalteromonas luteoviolacea TaxID=43657 RepID=UPI001B38957A|nr:FtsX-like permease family protein [Pseudoalteromonas luteoviolacea]MBQ4811231.1 FtsX-like permease family protein [Pseudoalteromonas luteoviolacea]